jgi:hypothetical protein
MHICYSFFSTIRRDYLSVCQSNQKLTYAFRECLGLIAIAIEINMKQCDAWIKDCEEIFSFLVLQRR